MKKEELVDFNETHIDEDYFYENIGDKNVKNNFMKEPPTTKLEYEIESINESSNQIVVNIYLYKFCNYVLEGSVEVNEDRIDLFVDKQSEKQSGKGEMCIVKLTYKIGGIKSNDNYDVYFLYK